MEDNDYKKVGDISASQWGLLTTAQAEQAGVSRLKISRMAERGQLVRLFYGVYRDAGAVSSTNESIKALWLSTSPKLFAVERLQTPDIIVGGTTATYLWECGDLDPYPYQFYSLKRRQTERDGLVYIKKDFTADDFMLVDGLPTARIEYVIADLIYQQYDLSLIADVLKDMRINMPSLSLDGLLMNQRYLVSCLNNVARGSGYKTGEDLLEHLLNLAGEGLGAYRLLLEALVELPKIPVVLPQTSVQNISEAAGKYAQALLSDDLLASFSKVMQNVIDRSQLERLSESLAKVVLNQAKSTKQDAKARVAEASREVENE